MQEEIASQMGIAQQTATSLNTAVNQLESDKVIQQDNQTTLQGNQMAKDYLTKESQIVQKFTLAFKQDIENIRSVAAEFESFDGQLQQNFEINLPTL
ncbi:MULTISPECIES: TIGR04197 family type VII secretion effector [Listeria]|uniref:TIGR04197 family type VII secretion effector n=1 Tax=Listeria TaxID=1637 RepID=UPI000B58E885|nr:MULTISPECIES: TIGR04197 family type VII secretion effector [Listeria]